MGFIKRVSQTKRYDFPIHWEVEGGFKTTHPGDERTAKQQNKIFIKPIKFKNTKLALTKNHLGGKTTRNLNWRNAANRIGTSNNKPIITRLTEFGLNFNKTKIIEKSWTRDPGFNEKQKKIYRRLKGKKAHKYWNDYQEKIKKKALAKKAELLAYEKKLAPILYVRNPKKDQYNSETCAAELDENYGLNDLTDVLSFRIRNNEYHLLRFECSGGGGRLSNGPSIFTVLASKTLSKGFIEIPFPISFKPIHIANDRYLFAWRNDRVFLYDLEKRTMLLEFLPEYSTQKKENITNSDLTDQFLLTNDLKHIIQLNKDGNFYVHNIKSKQRVLEGRYEDDELIVWTPDGNFDATAEGAHFARLAFPGRSGHYSFAQFDQKLKIDGLMQKVLSGETIVGETWQTVGTPPILETNLSVNENRMIIGKALVDTNNPLKSVNIYQDGLLTNIIDGKNSRDIEFSVPRIKGSRWISTVAIDELGLASHPVGVDLGSEKNQRTKLHYLTIGIDEYEQANDLSFGVSDANNLAKSIRALEGKTIELGVHKTLTNQIASKQEILDSIRSIVKVAQPGDTIVFSFAGHGVRDEMGRFYLGTSTIDPNKINETGLLWDDVVKLFKGSKTRIAVFLDACHSGAAGTDASIYATNDQVVSGLLAGMPPGLVVFSASKGRELSEEDGKRGGVFTNALTDVITHQRSKFDTNKNGSIEISELYNGVKKQVVKNARGKQTPWLARNQMVGDFALF